MKFCIDCKHFEPAPSIKWYEMLSLPEHFQDKCNNVGPDLVTGERRKMQAQWMRNGVGGYCGRDAVLFEAKI